jgi:hypothetical protein
LAAVVIAVGEADPRRRFPARHLTLREAGMRLAYVALTVNAQRISEATHLPAISDARAALRRHGYVHVPGWLDPDIADSLATLAHDTVQQYGTRVVRFSADDVLDYEVVTGDLIQSHAPPFFDLYSSPTLLTWIRSVGRVADLERSPHLRSSININCLRFCGQGYPWHSDAVPFTVLVFLTTLSDTDGGEFLIRPAREPLRRIQPVSGDLLLMDGQRCPHAVAALRANVCRLTVPMVYPAIKAARPPQLDSYLYDDSGRTGQG